MVVLSIAHLLNGLLTIAMPVGLAIFLTHKFRLSWRLWWIGAGTFVLSQVGHIPFNALVSLLLNRTSMVLWPTTSLLIFNAIFLGLSAGLFEELFRYGMFRWWAKDARSWAKGVLTGAGHGGAEAILIVAIPVLLGYINMSVSRLPQVQATLTGAQVQAVEAYWSMPWYAALLGALERFLTIPVQIALAVLVLQAFTRKQRFWVWLAVLYHALIDAAAVLLSNYINGYLLEGILGIFAVLSVIIIFALRRPEPDLEPAPVSSAPAKIFTPRSLEETRENLDKTRYR